MWQPFRIAQTYLFRQHELKAAVSVVFLNHRLLIKPSKLRQQLEASVDAGRRALAHQHSHPRSHRPIQKLQADACDGTSQTPTPRGGLNGHGDTGDTALDVILERVHAGVVKAQIKCLSLALCQHSFDRG